MSDTYATPIVPIDAESSTEDSNRSTETTGSTRVTDGERPRSTVAEFGAPLVPMIDDQGSTPALLDADDTTLRLTHPETNPTTDHEREAILPAVGNSRPSH